MPNLFPDYEMWVDLTTNSIGHRFSTSKEWDALDKAVREYSLDPDNDSLFINLKTATDAFVAKKTAADGVLETSRDEKGMITALRKYVEANPPEMSERELEAAREVIRANKHVLFRTLTNAEIRYKASKKLEMAKTLAEDAKDFRDNLMEIPQVADAAERIQSRFSRPASSAPPAPAQPPGFANPLAGMFKAEWDRMIREICSLGESVPDMILNELKELVGRQVFDAISSAIPYLGTIKEGAAVMNHLKSIATHEVNLYRVRNSKVYVRPGDVEAAFDCVVELLKNERVDLGIELAGSTTTFLAGVGTLGADGGAAQVVTSLAVSGAKLIRTIHSFVSDHIAMTKTNRMLKSAEGAHIPLLETISKFPLLGAYVINKLETSTILELNIMEINQPFFKFMTEHYNRKVESLHTSVARILEESRFEILQIEHARIEEIRLRRSFAESLQQQLTRALQNREYKKNMDAVIRDIPAAAARFHFRQVARQLAEKASILETMLLANMELEREMAALIDIRAMREQREAEINLNKALARSVKNALNTYKDQTTGFRALITSQSDESTAAISAMNSIVNSQNATDLRKLRRLVEYLLKINSKVPEGFHPGMRQLKNPSRLHGLLNSAYQSVMIAR